MKALSIMILSTSAFSITNFDLKTLNIEMAHSIEILILITISMMTLIMATLSLEY